MARPPDKACLEDFALPGLPLAKLTGVSAAVHAISDGFLLLHGGVGCKYKAAAQLAKHDLGSHPNQREGWTQVGELALIRGAAERIGPFARSFYERRRPGLMVVASATFIELTGEDVAAAVRQADATLPCDTVLIRTAAPNGGFFEGYAEVILELARRLRWSEPPRPARQATVVGHFFHRYEPDQQSDVAALQKLLKVTGLELGPVLLSGAPTAELQRAAESAVVIELPYSRPVQAELHKLYGRRRRVAVDLPIGLAGTERWLRAIAAATAGNQALVEAWIGQQRALLRARLARVAEPLCELPVALFADTPLCAGLASLLVELGAAPVVIGLRDTVLGGAAELRAVLGRNELELPAECTILERPSLAQIREICLRRVAAGTLGAVIGSSIELGTLLHLPPALQLVRLLPLIEVGFPAVHHHLAAAQPILGYGGVVAFAQRLLDALGLRLER